MSDQPETLAAILAKYRKDIAGGQFFTPTKEYISRLLDRIDAEAERERNEHTNDIHNALYMATGIPGNAAALREALNLVGHLANDLRNITERDTEVRADVNEIVDVCRAALAAPARNCDRFATANDAVEGYIAAHPQDDEPDASTYGSWLFATAKEGGAE